MIIKYFILSTSFTEVILKNKTMSRRRGRSRQEVIVNPTDFRLARDAHATSSRTSERLLRSGAVGKNTETTRVTR